MTLTYLNLLLGLLLVLVPAYLVYTYDRLLLSKATLSVVRMLVQLLVMGACLWAVFHFGWFWLCLLWLLLLVVAAAFLVVSRTHILSRVLFLPACVGMFSSVAIVGAYVLLVVLQPADPLNARWFVPVTGVLMAHLLPTSIRAIRTFYDSLTQDSQPYYTLSGNGASRLHALAPYITRTLRSMVLPATANLSAMGLFVMPMLLSGLLMGGLSPLQAMLSFVILIFASITASILSVAITLCLSCRHAFNRQGQILQVFTAD
jgi:putative ABC transport system permease protein